MAAPSGKTSIVATRYAGAFLDLIADSGAVEAIEADFTALAGILNESADLRRALSNPLFSRDEKQGVLSALCERAGFRPETRNFLGVLVHNNRISALAAIIAAFQADLRRRRGQVDAHVQAAHALTPAQTRALQENLSRAMGSSVALNVSVNKDILGGLIVTVGSRTVDDSLRRKLDRLQQSMSRGPVR